MIKFEKINHLVKNRLYGDKTYSGYEYDLVVEDFSFKAVVYKQGKSWVVSHSKTGAWIAYGDTKSQAVVNASEKLHRFDVERIKRLCSVYDAE